MNVRKNFPILLLLIGTVMIAFGLLSQLGLTREISQTNLGFSLSSLNLILGALLLGI